MTKYSPEDFPKNTFTLLPKPEKDINWGMQSVENEKVWKQWIADNIEKFIHFTLMCYGSCGYGGPAWKEKLNKMSSEIFNEIQGIGYTEGSESARLDAEEQY